MARDAALEVSSLSVRYGGVLAVDDVSLTVAGGEIVGLIGSNGAGKSSLVDAVTGFTPTTGKVLLNGRPISGLPAHRRARLGLARTWQSLELFTDLTVLENVVVASRQLTWRSVLADLVRPGRALPDGSARAALGAVGLSALADRDTSELSHGQRKLLGVARALASGSTVVLLDEPAAGLDTDESLTLGRRLRGVADRGVAVLLIDHDLDLVMRWCDRVYVLELGRLLAQGTPAQVRADARVRTAYLGQHGAGHDVLVTGESSS